MESNPNDSHLEVLCIVKDRPCTHKQQSEQAFVNSEEEKLPVNRKNAPTDPGLWRGSHQLGGQNKRYTVPYLVVIVMIHYICT